MSLDAWEIIFFRYDLQSDIIRPVQMWRLENTSKAEGGEFHANFLKRFSKFFNPCCRIGKKVKDRNAKYDKNIKNI
jgi:hypothetical protein